MGPWKLFQQQNVVEECAALQEKATEVKRKQNNGGIPDDPSPS